MKKLEIVDKILYILDINVEEKLLETIWETTN